MPTYEYECRRCGGVFERFQTITAPPLKRCPKCRGKAQRRIGTGAGFLFKGSGFYATDYRSESYKKAAKSEKTETGAKTECPKSESAKTESAKTESAKKPEKSPSAKES